MLFNCQIDILDQVFNSETSDWVPVTSLQQDEKPKTRRESSSPHSKRSLSTQKTRAAHSPRLSNRSMACQRRCRHSWSLYIHYNLRDDLYLSIFHGPAQSDETMQFNAQGIVLNVMHVESKYDDYYKHAV
jgi:hypothetical protein